VYDGSFLSNIAHIKAMLISLSVKAAAGRRPASFALGFFDPSPSGWTAGWSFFIGLLPVGIFDYITIVASDY
jgi:hypothetical protein